ncbi:hypothetical protein H0H81_000266 [Sphagnurus paluster]|uniref:Thioesterase domain-containing protein n=1 Tax=Sphagnurus paluster TaxID=117069 RepID=A0A9P7GKI6_9AGAR|nr:hypothetical protein H0H81_000266 [Sphagnurus paluster]
MSTSILRRIPSTSIRHTQRQTKPAQRRFLSTTPPASPKTWRPLATASAVAAFTAVAYTVGSIYPPSTLSLLFPRTAPGPPDPTSPESIQYTKSLEKDLQKLPLLKSLRENPDADQWYEVRPYMKFPEERRVNSLTSGALRGPGKLALHPLVRSKRDESESYVFTHLGRGLCGHDGIIHGGLLATLLDETLARTAIANLPDKFVIIRTFLNEAKGRKVTVTGRIEHLDGTVLVEATATFVQPRYAKLLNTEALKQAMGEAPKSHDAVHLADGRIGSAK